jgi:hypothetical protein
MMKIVGSPQNCYISARLLGISIRMTIFVKACAERISYLTFNETVLVSRIATYVMRINTVDV